MSLGVALLSSVVKHIPEKTKKKKDEVSKETSHG